MLEFYAIGLFILVIYSLTKGSKNKTTINNTAVNTASREYIKGYLDGFNDHKNNIENTQITRQFSSADASRANGVVANFGSGNRDLKPVLSEAELNDKRHLQNINTALFMACFLFVVAAALFMGESLPETVRFMGVWFVTILFYASGLVLYRKVPKLKAAATAFIGTGLALLPFTGFALNYFVLHDPELSWFITSIVGLVGYVFAAAYLRSQTIVYFVIAFMVSLSTSSVASLDLALIWYFVALIMLGSILTLIANLKPNSLPSYFSEPIEKTNSLVVPLTIVASLFNINNLVLSDYWLIFAVCTVYYTAVATTAVTEQTKNYAYLAARLIGMIAILIACYDFTDSYVSLGLALSMVGVAQVMISTFSMPIKKVGDLSNELCLWLGFGLQLIAPLLVQSDDSWPILVIIQMFSLMVGGFGVAYYLRRVELSLFGTVAVIILPLVWGMHAMTPHIEGQWLSVIFASFVAITLAIRYLIKNIKIHPNVHQALAVNFGLYLVFMLLCTVDITKGWMLTIWLLATLMTYAMIYIEKLPVLLIVSNMLAVITLFHFVDYMNFEGSDITLAMLWLSMILFYVGHLVLSYLKKPTYAMYFWSFAIISGLFFGAIGQIGFDAATATVSAIGFIIAAGLLGKFGWSSKNNILVDVSLIVSTMSLQRVVGLNIPDLDFLIYTHWWALSFAIISMLRLSAGQRDASKVYTILGMFCITFFGFIMALTNMSDGVSIYSILYFLEHAIMLIYGLVASMKLQRNWAIVALVFAMLWMMDGFNFILPAGVATLLIIFAVKALSKQSAEK